jgi:hypothetical protein
MAKDVIGYVKCGECGYENAEVKETKRNIMSKPLVMVWCPHPDCLSQHFPRSFSGSKRIRDRMRPVEVEAEAIEPAHKETPKASGGIAEFFNS